MVDKNVQIQQRNAANDAWDNIYPKTKAALVEQDVNNRFVSDAEKTTWGNKQDKLNPATTTVAGTMSAADKQKLDGITAGATKYEHPAEHSPSIIKQDTNNRFVSDAEKTSWDAKQSPITVVTTAPTTGTAANQLIFVQV